MELQHPLAGLDEEQRRALLTYYRKQEAAGILKISSSDFQDGELLVCKYTDQYNETTAPANWDWRMELARGCVLFKSPGSAPEVVVQAMPKFHGWEHCPEAISYIEADGPLAVMQKHDGTCISITCFRGEVLIFTLGSRHNLQTQLARDLLSQATMAVLASIAGRTLALELIHHRDGKVEESRGPDRLVLLYACEAGGRIVPPAELPRIAADLGLPPAVGCEATTGQGLMRRLEALSGVSALEDLREGFVVEFSGKKYKVKPQLYKAVARSPVPKPSRAWMAKCFVSKKSLGDVQEEVERMQGAPLDFGSLASGAFHELMASAGEHARLLRTLQATFASPKELHQSKDVEKADKLLLFPCLKLPAAERPVWFESEACRFAVAQSLARRILEPDDPPRRGFAVGPGRLVLCGAPGKKAVEAWAEGLDCVVTLLRAAELRDRGLDLAAVLAPLHAEWLHLPVSGAALAEPGDRPTVRAAACAVAERLRAGRAVAVHCSAGLHRTGAVGYLALRSLGHSRPSAWELLGQIRWETRAELERICYRGRTAVPDAEVPADLISVAEELLLEPDPAQEAA